MILYTDTIARNDVWAALNRAKWNHKVTNDIDLVQFDGPNRSRNRKFSFKIQLGTYDKTSGPTKSRHYKNSGQYGAGDVWAATYDEWGWFIAELFAVDPDAIFGPYKGLDSFNAQTANKYILAYAS